MSKRTVCRGSVGVGVAVAVLFLGSTLAGAAPAKSVSPERWIRGVCRETSDWMDAREVARGRIAEVTADLTAGELTGKQAGQQLAAVYASASEDTQQAIDAIRGAGTPKVTGGKAISTAYQARLAEYQRAYDTAKEGISDAAKAGGAKADATALATAAAAIETTLTSDLAVVGGDPLEELRVDEVLSAPITASCAAVDEHLGSTVDAGGCRAALTTAREHQALNDKFLDVAEGSPEETALGEQLYALVNRWRTELGGCNTAAVLGPCRAPLDTGNALVKASADYELTTEGTPEDDAALDAMLRLDRELAGQLPKCTA